MLGRIGEHREHRHMRCDHRAQQADLGQTGLRNQQYDLILRDSVGDLIYPLRHPGLDAVVAQASDCFR